MDRSGLKYVLVALLIFGSFPTLLSQNNSTFYRKFNRGGMQGGLGVAAMPDGGFVGAGQFEGSPSHGDCDTYVYRVDPCGNTLWMKLFGGSGQDGGKSLFVRQNGNIVVYGFESNSNAFFIELSPDGNLIQGKKFIGRYMVTAGAELSDGRFVFISFAGGQHTLFVFNPLTGTVDWAKNLSGNHNSSVQQLPDGNILAISAYASGGVFQVYKFSQSGAQLWAKNYGSMSYFDDHSDYGCFSVYSPHDSTVLITTPYRTLNEQIQITKLNPDNGAVVWAKHYGGPGSDQSRKLLYQNDGIYVVGNSNSFPRSANSTNAAGVTQMEQLAERDVLLFKIGHNGNVLWSRTYGGNNRDKGIGMSIDPTVKGIIISGYSSSSYFNSNNYDPIFIRTDSLGLIGCQMYSPTLAESPISYSITSLAAASSQTLTPSNYAPSSVNFNPQDQYLCLTCSTAPLIAASDTLVCVGDTVKFYNTSTVGLKCFQEWDISGQKFPGYQDTLKIAYSQPGNFPVYLYSNCGANSDTFVYNINVVQTQVSAGPDVSICPGTPVTLSATGSGLFAQYVWSNGVQNGVSFIPSSSANYTVVGTDANGCESSDDLTVTINPNPLIDAGPDIAVCAGTSLVLSATGAGSGGSYTWTPNIINGVAFTPAQTNYYKVVGTDVNGCVSSDSVLISVNSIPPVDAGPDVVVCPNEPIVLSASGAGPQGIYTWNNGVIDGVQFVPGATQWYTVVGTDTNGCVETDSLLVKIRTRPTVQTAPYHHVCAGDPITLSAWSPLNDTISSFVWSNGVANGASFIPQLSGETLWVYATDYLGCMDTSFTVVYFTTISPVSELIEACEDSPSQMRVSPNISYGIFDRIEVDFGDGQLQTIYDSSWNHTYINPGFYSVTVRVYTTNGCFEEVVNAVEIYPKPKILFAVEPGVVSEFYPLVRTSNSTLGAVAYSWDFGDGTSLSNEFEPIHVFPYRLPASYWVKQYGISEFGCVQVDSVLAVVEEELVYHIPNAFTPNGEGVLANEYFMPVFYSGYDPNFLEFYILNRWGDELFFTDQFGVGWDGTFRGSNQTTGAYLYKIRFKRKKDGKLIEHINRFLLIE